MSNNSSVSASLVKLVNKYRVSMASCLQASLAGINDFLSPVDIDGIFVPINQAEFDDDPAIAFRKMSYVLIAKARLHVFATLTANRSNNIHSLAVQMRPALECSGQVVPYLRSLRQVPWRRGQN